MKYLTFKQLRELHNNNESVIALMGKDLAANKQLLRTEMFRRKPQVFR